MTDLEYTVLDELYFVQSFDELLKLTELDKVDLVSTLQSLNERGWVKVLHDVDNEVNGSVDWVNQFNQYYYLATKSGLMAHNTN